MLVGLREIVRGHDRSAVQKSIGIGRIRGRSVESPDLRRECRVDAEARSESSSYAEHTATAPDPGHACIAEHPTERAVEHLQANKRIVGDSDRGRAIPQRPSSNPRRLGDLLSVTEPQNLAILHRPVLPDRTYCSVAPLLRGRGLLCHTYPTLGDCLGPQHGELAAWRGRVEA